MVSFRKNIDHDKVAQSISKGLSQSGLVQSIRTLENYSERLEQVGKNLSEYGIGARSVKELTPETAKNYLQIRSEFVGQKTLDMERQAIQASMHLSGVLAEKERLGVVKCEKLQSLESRAYTTTQVNMIANAQTAKYSLSTQIAHSAGLRAHELLTIQRIDTEKKIFADNRPASPDKFTGRSGEKYLVTGKGGLTREVLIPKNLSEQLEKTRLGTPRDVKDRGVDYVQRYDIAGGHKWSSSFSQASNRALEWSTGAHGVRHAYAQERMDELRKHGFSREQSLKIVSQEMGHFRPEITEVYLR